MLLFSSAESEKFLSFLTENSMLRGQHYEKDHHHKQFGVSPGPIFSLYMYEMTT